MQICSNWMGDVIPFYRGRVALYAMLKALGVSPGEEVMTQAFTCVAVPEAIMAVGARPIYVDIGAEGFNMDAEELQRKVNCQTKAIIIQHTYGIPAHLDRILNIAQEHRIPVIEDCCHTLMSKWGGRKVGSFGVGSFYSFEWGKPLVAGIGGSLRINDPVLQEKVRFDYASYKVPSLVSQARIDVQYRAFSLLYRPLLYWPLRSLFHGLGSLGVAEGNYNPVSQQVIAADFKLRMSPAVKRRMIGQLKTLGSYRRHSQWVTGQYRRRVRSDLLSHPVLPEHSDTVFVRYPLLAKNKPDLLEAAKKARVELADWYATPVHPLGNRELAMVGYEMGSCPNAEARSLEVVTLPTHPGVRQHDINRAVWFLNEIKA